jgi:8-amino-7-oxononanoate synthase
MLSRLDRLADQRRRVASPLVGRLRQEDALIQQLIQAVAGSRACIDGDWVLNFAATNYLGLSQHPHLLKSMLGTVSIWGTSLGMPRLLATDSLTAHLERKIARLTRQQKALMFPSTTHIALDVLPLLAGREGVLFLDEWAYPISLEGARAAAQRGARLHRFPHNDPCALARALQSHARVPDKVIVCDGVYSAGGQPASLHEIERLARRFDAVVYVDDAHGIGLLGEAPGRKMPYGYGGGGTPRYLDVAAGNILHVGSLSKAFGVSVAFVAGPASFIDYLHTAAASYTHSSPPALPVLAAALAALQVHTTQGDALRRRLAARARGFLAGLAGGGVNLPANRLFPIQTLPFASPQAAEAAARQLRRQGIWGVLQFNPPDHPAGGVVRFVLSAAHRPADIDAAVGAILRLVGHPVRS